jgi:hypothetical protein
MAFVQRRRPRGLAAANCPSLKQLMGIVDPSDPCQSTQQSQVPEETPYPVVFSPAPTDQELWNQQIWNLLGPPTPAPGTSAGSGLPGFLAANPLAVWGIIAAVGVVTLGAVFGGGGRR